MKIKASKIRKIANYAPNLYLLCHISAFKLQLIGAFCTVRSEKKVGKFNLYFPALPEGLIRHSGMEFDLA